MPKIEIEILAKELGALPCQVSFVLAELGAFPENGTVNVDEDTLELAKEAVSEYVHEKLLVIAPGATPRDLANALGVPHVDVQKTLVKAGALVPLTSTIDESVAEKIVKEFGYSIKWAEPPKPKKKESEQTPRKRALGTQHRPPVVTIMGHVDHGKTSLLDYIRKTKVVDKEFGGITQHIGAYQVVFQNKKITFLDTPGHAAFTAMRARGAQVTDIAILVVAADDGVMPQTIEAINHAKNADVPIIVAINKIDKPEANPMKVKQQLTEYELVAEEFGGQTTMVPVSAMTGEGIDNLLELILLQAEIMDLKADPSGNVEGVVIEARLDRGRGPVATILVENGTLTQGSIVVVGQTWGRVKAMFDFNGKPIKDAGPSTPVEILGLDAVPSAGDRMKVFLDEREARETVEEQRGLERQKMLDSTGAKISLEMLQKKLQGGEVKELRLVIKGDVQGSVEAVVGLVQKIENPEVDVKVIHTGVGPITENDILLASASGGIVVGFNVKVEPGAKTEAERQRVEIRLYKVIYELIEDIEKAVKGMLEPKYEEQELGTVEIRAVFKLTKAGHVAGCYVKDGKVTRGNLCRVIRNGEVIYQGKIDSLKHLKEDVREVAAGYECGVQFDNFKEYQVGDIIQVYDMVRVG